MARKKLGDIVKHLSFGTVQDGWPEDDTSFDPPDLAATFSSESGEMVPVVIVKMDDDMSQGSITSHTHSQYRVPSRQMFSGTQHGLNVNQVLRAILMFLCVAIFVVTVSAVNRYPQSRESERFRRLLRRVQLHSRHPQYTVLIRGERLDATFRAVQRYTECPNALSVKVEWSRKEEYPPILAEYNSPVETDAIVALDERQFASCEDLDRSFAVWRDDPGRMVGDADGVMVVHKWFWNSKRWNAEVPLLGLSRTSAHKIWYLGKRYYR